MDVAAAVDVHAVAVRINFQIVDGEVICSGGENREMAAMQNREIAQRDVAAIFQADGLVADARIFRFWCRGAGALAESLAPDQSRPGDRDVFDSFAPDQTVVPVAVAVILIFVPLIRLGRIVAAAAGRWTYRRRQSSQP